MRVPVNVLVPLYLHCTGAGNVGELNVFTDKEQLITSVAGGTATVSVTPKVNGRLRKVVMSIVPAAAGTWEFSKNSTSQIATAAPDQGVLARARVGVSLGGGYQTFEFD